MGIEPTTSAWKAEVLPVNYTRIFKMINIVKLYPFDSLYDTQFFLVSQPPM